LRREAAAATLPVGVIWRQSTSVRDQLELMRGRRAGGRKGGSQRRPARSGRVARLLQTGRSTVAFAILLGLNLAVWLGVYLLAVRVLG
jgi:hypothetical protein